MRSGAAGSAAAGLSVGGTVKSQADWFAERAQAAWQNGQAALAAGDVPGGLRWLERAHRIAPDDAGISFTLATVRARSGALGPAVALLNDVAATLDMREVWLALARLRLRLGNTEGAVAAFQHAASGHALPPHQELRVHADQLARQTGRRGWCGVTADGSLVIGLAAPGDCVVSIDGVAQPAPPAQVPATARRLTVSVDGEALIGSPVDLARIRRVEGIVSVVDGGLEGWAWHPAAPERDPVLLVRAAGAPAGPPLARLVADDLDMVAPTPLARPRRFRVPTSAFAAVAGLVTVMTEDGQALLGSPLDPGRDRREAVAAARAVAALFPAGGAVPARPVLPEPGRAMAVVVPVYGGAALVERCLASVLATVPPRTKIIVVDDASPDPAVRVVLRRLGGTRVRVLRHDVNQGFPAAANTGLRAAMALPGRHDVVLLNSDTVVPPGWLAGLRAAVQGSEDVGTATPLSNDATILSYPDPEGGNPPPADDALARWSRQAGAAAGTGSIDIPTAVGFCMYVRRECLAETGLFRTDLFAQGYGEENDFCVRARHLGWRHVAVPGVFVAHVGGQSFGPARAHLIARNLAVLEALHPGYHQQIAAFKRADPLAAVRRRIDVARWRDGRQAAGSVVLVSHDSGGGVERVVRERCAAIRAEGLRPIVLRSTRAREGKAAYLHGRCRVEEGAAPAGAAGHPNLRFDLPREIGLLVRLLRGDRPQRVELHHLLGHDHAIAGLARLLDTPLDIHVHDYAALCPRISLLGRDGRYCGEPEDPATCDACVRDLGSNTTETIGVAALRARSAADLAAARRVVVPSADAAMRLRRYFPAVTADVVPLENDAAYPASAKLPAPPGRIGIIGGIGTEKGYDVLLACARNAAMRRLNLHFTVIGHTPDDDRLLETGHVFVTGPYKDADVLQLIRSQEIDLAWQPSIWPETWCFTLGIAWRAGLRVAAFDIGALAERIRQTGRGWLLPLGLPPASINSAFLGLR